MEKDGLLSDCIEIKEEKWERTSPEKTTRFEIEIHTYIILSYKNITHKKGFWNRTTY